MAFLITAYPHNAAAWSTPKPPTPLLRIDVSNLVSAVKPERNYTRDVLEPLHKAQEERERQERTDTAKELQDAAQAPSAVLTATPEPPTQAVYVDYSPAAGLTGSYGWAVWSGNCAQVAGVNNPGYGNPIDWPATSESPWIGASALFYYNHVGVVTGIWPNGDLEIHHQGFQGYQHRFPRSMFRGFR